MRCSFTDPVGGGYAFSYIGLNGTMAGGGDTENSRWDDALKYRLPMAQFHFGPRCIKFAQWFWRLLLGTAGWTAATVRRKRPIMTPYGSDFGGKTPASSPPTWSTNITTGHQRTEPLAGAAESDGRPVSVHYRQPLIQPPSQEPNLIDPNNTGITAL